MVTELTVFIASFELDDFRLPSWPWPTDQSADLLGEAIPENLKNMLLVMSNAAVFEEDNNYQVERKRHVNEAGQVISHVRHLIRNI